MKAFFQQIISRLWKLLPLRAALRIVWILSPKFNVGVTGIVENSDGKVLVLKHILRRKYHWGFPSGWMAHGETPEAALSRELNEEVGIAINSWVLVKVCTDHRFRIDIVMRGQTTVSDVQPRSLEITEAEFFSRESLPKGMLPEHITYIREC